MSGKTKFEEDLKVYFPDLYKFWSMVKFDAHADKVLAGMLKMMNGDEYGKIVIVFQAGKINRVNMETQLTADKKIRQHY